MYQADIRKAEVTGSARPLREYGRPETGKCRYDPQRMQAPGRSRLPHRGGISPRSPGEVHQARTSLDAPPLVGQAPAGILPGRADGPAAARPLRPPLPQRSSRGPEQKNSLLGNVGRALRGGSHRVKTDDGLRQVLLRFITDFANWDNSAKAEYLETGRGLVKAAHPEQTPLAVDPFAGGGSIPLEALRLGCDAFASDLNPVACLILKVMLEDIPRHGPSDLPTG